MFSWQNDEVRSWWGVRENDKLCGSARQYYDLMMNEECWGGGKRPQSVSKNRPPSIDTAQLLFTVGLQLCNFLCESRHKSPDIRTTEQKAYSFGLSRRSLIIDTMWKLALSGHFVLKN